MPCGPDIRFRFSGNAILISSSPRYSDRLAVWYALSNVGISSRMFIDGSVTSEIYLSVSNNFVHFLVRYGISTYSAQFKNHTLVEPISCAIWGRNLMATNATGLNFAIIFCLWHLKDLTFRNNFAPILEMKTGIQLHSWYWTVFFLLCTNFVMLAFITGNMLQCNKVSKMCRTICEIFIRLHSITKKLQR